MKKFFILGIVFLFQVSAFASEPCTLQSLKERRIQELKDKGAFHIRVKASEEKFSNEFGFERIHKYALLMSYDQYNTLGHGEYHKAFGHVVLEYWNTKTCSRSSKVYGLDETLEVLD